MSRGHKNKRRGEPDLAKPQMTSLVDVLTVLVFFLLKNFSTEGDIVTQSPGLTLPDSDSRERPQLSPVIAISKEHILAEGMPLARVDEESRRQGYVVPALAEWLQKKRETTEKISRVDTSVDFTGTLSIQGDKAIPFAVLQKVLVTCGEKGYSRFAFTVNQKNPQ